MFLWIYLWGPWRQRCGPRMDFSRPVKQKHVASLMSHSELLTEGAEVFSSLLQQQQKHWKCQMWGPNQQIRGSLKGSHQYRKGKKHLCSSREPSQRWSPLFLEGTAESSFNYSRYGLFMCHVLGCREEELQVHFLWILPWEIFTSSVTDWQFRLKNIHGLAKSSSMNLLTSPSHTSCLFHTSCCP